jgi:oxygen-dependent protoporphyrinogen oxidase
VHVVVVGAGISGLAAALSLRTRPDPPEVTLLEADAEIGGKLRVGDLDGMPVDAGAEALGTRRGDLVDLVAAAGLADDLVESRTSMARLELGDRLLPFPAGTLMGVPGDLPALAASGLLTRAALARVRVERVLSATAGAGDVSVGRYVTARMGRQVTDRLVEPWLSRRYAGCADTMSLAATMPVLAGARERGERAGDAVRRHLAHANGTAGDSAPVVGIRGGVGRLPPAVLAAASGATLHARTTVRSVTRTADGRWRVETGPVPRPWVLEADAVVVAVPARPAARMLRDAVPAAALLLDTVEYASVAVVLLGYARSQVATGSLVGSGHLVTPSQGSPVTAVTYAGQKWAWLARQRGDLEVLSLSVGRVDETEVLQRDDADLVALAADEVTDVLGVSARPVVGAVHRWGGALPQYTVGHVARAERVHAMVGALPGLALCGAALDGVEVTSCVTSGKRAAEQVLSTARPGREASGR